MFVGPGTARRRWCTYAYFYSTTMNRNSLLCVGLAFGIGCASATEPLADVRVAATIEPRGNPADPVSIVTTATNAGNHSIVIETNPCPARFRVETITGIRVAGTEQVCPLFSQQTTLAPGQTFSFHDRWNGTDSNGRLLSGTYRIIGQPFLDHGPQSAPVLVQFP